MVVYLGNHFNHILNLEELRASTKISSEIPFELHLNV